MRRWLAMSLVVVLGLGGMRAWAVEADPISPGSWTMILLPDTQNYCDTDPEALIFNSQTEWIRDHAASHNIKMVLHQGDVTNGNTAAQFTRAKTALGILETAGVPYSVGPGNHDYALSTRTSLFNNAAYFGPGSAYALQSGFQDPNPAVSRFFEAGKTDNSWCTFNAGGKDWLVFSAEFGPRDEVIAWMDGVAAAHPNHNFILNQHAYLYSDDTRHDWVKYGTAQQWNPHAYDPMGTENDGQEQWDKLVKKYPNWKFTFNGHVLNDGTGWLASVGDSGNVVHQMLANYQMKTNGGNGYLRILEFMNDGDTVKVSSYSPYVDAYLKTADQEFTLSMTTLPPEPPAPPTIRGVSGFSLAVTDGTSNATSAWTIVGSGPGVVSLISPANIADVSLAVDGIPTYREQGVMMATVRQNLRGTSYGTVEVSYTNHFGGDVEANVLQVATSRATTGGEFNVDPALGFFPFADGWISSHVNAAGAVLEHYGVAASDVALSGTGRYTVALDGVYSTDDGILLGVSAENGANYISTAPRADGTGWDVALRDNMATAFDAFESARWGFVYVDYDAPGLTGGRIGASGTTLSGAGSFSVSHVGTGVYRITVNGGQSTPSDGVLMLTVAQLETEEGATGPADNIITYEADGNTFLVNVRDRNGPASDLADCGFVFAFLSYDGQLMPAVPGDANYDGQVDQADANALASHWGDADATWAMGDFNLDGQINAADASILAANWTGAGEQTGVPEPSAIVLLAGLSMAWCLRRRSTRRSWR